MDFNVPLTLQDYLRKREREKETDRQREGGGERDRDRERQRQRERQIIVVVTVLRYNVPLLPTSWAFDPVSTSSETTYVMPL